MQFAPKRNGQQKSERALFYGPIKKDYERGMYVLLLLLLFAFFSIIKP